MSHLNFPYHHIALYIAGVNKMCFAMNDQSLSKLESVLKDLTLTMDGLHCLKYVNYNCMHYSLQRLAKGQVVTVCTSLNQEHSE